MSTGTLLCFILSKVEPDASSLSDHYYLQVYSHSLDTHTSLNQTILHHMEQVTS